MDRIGRLDAAGSVAVVATLFRLWAVMAWITLVLSLLTGGGPSLSPNLFGFAAASGLLRGDVQWYRWAKLMLVFDLVFVVAAWIAVVLAEPGRLPPMRLYGTPFVLTERYVILAFLFVGAPFHVWQLAQLFRRDVRVHFEDTFDGDESGMQRRLARYESAMGYRYGAVVLFAAAFAWLLTRPRGPNPMQGDWDASRNASVDSVSRAMAAAIGAPPSSLARCGSGHVFVEYRNAPIDLRPPGWTGVMGVGESVGETIADVLRHLDQSLRSDTVSVRLERSLPPSEGGRGETMLLSYVPTRTPSGVEVLHRVRIPPSSCERHRRGLMPTGFIPE